MSSPVWTPSRRLGQAKVRRDGVLHRRLRISCIRPADRGAGLPLRTSVHPCEYADMSTLAHPIDGPGVRRAQGAGLTTADADVLGQLLGLLSDPTRVRVLFALVSVDELCVGDLALALGISVDQSSYALKLLRGAGLVQFRRDGRVMHYRLADGFPHQLLEHCLRQLLTIADSEARR